MENHESSLNVNGKQALMLFYLTVILLFLGQLLYTLHSNNQIRYEELAESVRNVYWLQQKTIYDGVSSNVGWYGTILFIYKIFGFSLNASRYYRLIIYLVSIICIALLLKKYMGTKQGLAPLIVIGLSPTMLFFNTLQTSYGIDIPYLLICVFLIDILNFTKKIVSIILQVLLGFIAMLALMSYPVFGFALPSLIIFYFIKLHSQNTFQKKKVTNYLKNIFVSVAAFMFPLLLIFFYVKDVNLLISDPVAGSGIFRGAGSFNFTYGTFITNIGGLLQDLFIRANSYYFDIQLTEFSSWYPIPAVVLVFGTIGWMSVKYKKYRVYIGLIVVLFLSNFLLGNLTADPSGRPGMRRNTGVLISFYGLYTLSWYYLTTQHFKRHILKIIAVIILLLIPVHHILSYFPNIATFSTLSIYRYRYIFSVAETPAKSLDYFIQSAQIEELPLGCKDAQGNLVTCRYSESYAAIAGACFWNNLQCNTILGFDQKTNQYIPISIRLWETYYWEH